SAAYVQRTFLEDAALDTIKLLADRGLDINAFNANGATALHNAVSQGADSVVRFLAERGAELDMRDKQGRTPLDIALGVIGRGGRAGGNGGGGARGRGGAVHESTAALLRKLMVEKGLPVPAEGAPPKVASVQ